jgi:hypothetical protein
MSSEERVSLASKPRALVLLLVSAGLTVLIAAGLPFLAFKPGLPLPSFAEGQVVLPPVEGGPPGMPMSSIAGIIVLIVLAVSFLALVVWALKGVHWKRLLPAAFSLLWKLALVAGVILLVISLLPRNPGVSPGVPMPPPKPVATAPLGAVPPVLIWVAAIMLAAAIALLTVRMLLARRPQDPRTWELEVEQARQALLDGHDLREVIIRCYRRMGEALQEERGIEREASMTTGEFEELLADKGLPREPVRQLTRLFEAARYSLWQPAAGEEQDAIRCLDAILSHVRQLREAGSRQAGVREAG